MVNYEPPSLDQIFSALSDPTRRAILLRLTDGEATVSEVAEPFEMTAPAISKHLRVLEEAGLITRRKDGRTHYLHLNASTLKDAADWLAHYKAFWETQIDSLERYLQETDDDHTSP